ncbi:hypothetical protein [Nocardia fusca]|uniref:hypothetical protein n=1 Tax=Nocardia fusca TaxID=941183 RepID=UPI0007A75D83|nr:hypothetical protein [Nocardia fusca]
MAEDKDPQTRTDLSTHIESIKTQAEDLKGQPDRANDAFGTIVFGVRAAGWGFFGLVGGGTAEAVVDRLWDERDQVLKYVAEADAKLTELIRGIMVPLTFIDYANAWRDVASAVTNAGTQIDETKLNAHWSGIAAEAYENSRIRQAKPCGQLAIPASCEEIALSLEAVAVKTLALYQSIADAILSLISSIGEIVAIAATGPIAAAQTGDLVAAIADAYAAILQAVGEIASTAQETIIGGNKIAQASSDIDGLPDNKWPPMAVDGNSKFDDATVLDGTNKWSVNTDRVTQ